MIHASDSSCAVPKTTRSTTEGAHRRLRPGASFALRHSGLATAFHSRSISLPPEHAGHVTPHRVHRTRLRPRSQLQRQSVVPSPHLHLNQRFQSPRVHLRDAATASGMETLVRRWSPRMHGRCVASDGSGRAPGQRMRCSINKLFDATAQLTLGYLTGLAAAWLATEQNRKCGRTERMTASVTSQQTISHFRHSCMPNYGDTERLSRCEKLSRTLLGSHHCDDERVRQQS